jgi:hypothetical protein
MDDAISAHTVVVSRKSPGGVEGSHQINLVAQVPSEITPEIVAVVQAAANQFVGRRVRILSIKVLSESHRDSGRWVERGRDMIQASHNVVQHRH